MQSNFKLTVIEFTAFDADGEKYFIRDMSDEYGNGKMIIKNNETATDVAIKSLEDMCNTVYVQKVTEYELEVKAKKEVFFKEKFEPAKQLEYAVA